MEFGLYTFAETTPDPLTRTTTTARDRLRDLVEEAELADQVGLDVFAVGEHHRPDFAISAPAVVLGALAARTRRIRLSSAVSVLSSDDPVRVFQQFATLDLLSDGRAEIIAGRGSFIESFPLFGYNLDDYDALFAEKLELLLRLRGAEHVTWSGKHRAALTGQGVYPRPLQPKLPIWVGVGGNPESAIRAGRLGLPMALAIIGGFPERFAPLVELYREAGRKAGHDPTTLEVSINSHGVIGDDGERAANEAYPGYEQIMNKIGRERGWPPTSRSQYDGTRGLRGALVIGSPQQVIEKLLYQHELFQHQRFLLYPGFGTMPHASVMRTIELLGDVVAPAVRKAVGHSPMSTGADERRRVNATA
jgi:probable LLM family oxidoreductase